MTCTLDLIMFFSFADFIKLALNQTRVYSNLNMHLF